MRCSDTKGGNCGKVLAQGAKFCPFCGSTAEERNAGEAQQSEFRSVFKECVEDGVLDPGEVKHLRDLRERLGVSTAFYEGLFGEFQVFKGIPLDLQFDPENVFIKANSPTTFMVRVVNCAGDYQLTVKSVEFRYTCTTGSGLMKAKVVNILKDQNGRLSFDIKAPPSAGMYSLEGVLVAEFKCGRIFRAKFIFPRLHAKDRDDTPVAQNVSIHLQGDANIVRAGGPVRDLMIPPDRGSLIKSTRWESIDLIPYTEDQVVEWVGDIENVTVEGNSGLFRKKIPTKPVADPKPEPKLLADYADQTPALPCRGVLLRVLGQGEPAEQDIWMVRGQCSFGRDPSRADFIAALEPYAPTDEFRENFSHSQKVSGEHLKFSITKAALQFTDLGSANGTMLNGARVARHHAGTLCEDDLVSLANVLALRVRLIRSLKGGVFAARLFRDNNTKHRSYLLAPDGVGLWEKDDQVVGLVMRSGRPAGAVLEWQKRALCVRNHSKADFTVTRTRQVESVKIQPGQRAFLRCGDRIEMENQITILVAEILAD